MFVSAKCGMVCHFAFNRNPVIGIILFNHRNRDSWILTMCLNFADATEVLTRNSPSSISAHTGVTCGDPSLDKVERKAKFLPSKSFVTSSLEITITPADSSVRIRSYYNGDGSKSVISTGFMIASLSILLGINL
jgi:hypothetical protein